MHVAIAGGHGQIALLLTRLLAARGDRVTGIIRNPAHAADVAVAGGSAVVLDLEHTGADAVADAISGADALVFAAGAGPGSSIERKATVDHAASDLCVSAAQQAGVARFVQISAMGTDEPPQDDSVFSGYLRAKAAAEGTLRHSDLAWTVLRPGRLTDDPGTGRVTLARHVPRDLIPRADVALVVEGLLDHPATAGRVIEVVSGDDDVAQAIERLE